MKPSEYTKRARSGVIPGGLFLFMHSFLCGVVLCWILAAIALRRVALECRLEDIVTDDETLALIAAYNRR